MAVRIEAWTGGILKNPNGTDEIKAFSRKNVYYFSNTEKLTESKKYRMWLGGNALDWYPGYRIRELRLFKERLDKFTKEEEEV